MKYEEMQPSEINAVLRSCPLAYVVWGALEWHGVHNPIGLDALKAYYMTLELCRATGGVVLPPVYCGYQTMKPWAGFKHTIEISKETVEQLLYEYLENLYDEGFKAIVVVMGHYGARHVATIKRAVQRFAEKHKYPKVMAITDYDPASWTGIKGGDHAGKNETSLMLHFRPELVDLSRLPDGPLDSSRDGCTEDAKQATPEHGARLAKVFVEQAAPKVLELLKEAREGWPEVIATGD